MIKVKLVLRMMVYCPHLIGLRGIWDMLYNRHMKFYSKGWILILEDWNSYLYSVLIYFLLSSKIMNTLPFLRRSSDKTCIIIFNLSILTDFEESVWGIDSIKIQNISHSSLRLNIWFKSGNIEGKFWMAHVLTADSSDEGFCISAHKLFIILVISSKY